MVFLQLKFVSERMTRETGVWWHWLRFSESTRRGRTYSTSGLISRLCLRFWVNIGGGYSCN